MIAAILAAAAVSAASLGIDPTATVPLAAVAADHAPGSCHYRTAANGMPLPDPACTPGAVNPTLTLRVLRGAGFRTGLVRDRLTSAERKRIVYSWYGIVPPAHNTGAAQVCELDHLVDLSGGGADSLENIFPQCQRPGDPPVPVGARWFKVKDAKAEHVIIDAIKAGGLDQAGLDDLQRRIATDWTSLLSPPSDEAASDKPGPDKASPARGVCEDLTPSPAE